MIGARAITLRFGNLPIEYVRALEGYADDMVLWGYDGDDCYYFDISLQVTDFRINKDGVHLANDFQDWDLEIELDCDDSEVPCFLEMILNNPDMNYAVEVPVEVFERFYYDETFNGCCIAKWWKEHIGSPRV